YKLRSVIDLVIVGWALAHQQTIVRYFGGLKPTLRKVRIDYVLLFRSNHYDDFMNCVVLLI
ncbi:TPA: hypothetical protein ACPGTY_001731, partial [Haemophilus influenzae]